MGLGPLLWRTMTERSYWYVASAPLSVPGWPEVASYETELGGGRVVAPRLFSTQEKAETQLRWIAEGEAEAYLRVVEEFGEEDMNEALDNTPEQGVFEIGTWLLGEQLKDSYVEYVVVDDQMRLWPGNWRRS